MIGSLGVKVSVVSANCTKGVESGTIGFSWLAAKALGRAVAAWRPARMAWLTPPGGAGGTVPVAGRTLT